MATTKELGLWLKNLQGTMWFEEQAHIVFERLVHGKGNSVIILQGPSGTNKSYFLKMIKAFQKGVPEIAKGYFSDDTQRLLAEVDVSQYQCVDIEEEYPPKDSPPSSYRVALDVILPLSIASASNRRGLKKGHHTVVLCDDLHKFMHGNESNLTFLNELSQHSSKDITFLGAYTVDEWDKADGLKHTVLASHVLVLGYDSRLPPTNTNE